MIHAKVDHPYTTKVAPADLLKKSRDVKRRFATTVLTYFLKEVRHRLSCSAAARTRHKSQSIADSPQQILVMVERL